ncbi:hypothetical protein F2Q70_00003835 [Brassica cretica]|uniref:Uncharacterized protein n=1 Tax=Brassica cretica TaxID=69181 RepID=A0A8S9IUH6_BRACR|nr:hypothetical protein F2Q70_00003835 [Brassica cretica]KAF3519527.1 hypothetical protein DY000_02061745 [Brassica cretica]
MNSRNGSPGELDHDTSQVAGRARPCCRSTHRRARPRHKKARPASTAVLPVDSPAKLGSWEETGFRWKNHAYTNGYFASKIVKTLKSRYDPKRVRIADNGPSMVPKDLNPETGMTVYLIPGKR